MKFANLQELIQTSSSSRMYLLSLPVDIQLQLHEQNNFIHSLYELHTNAEYLMKYRTYYSDFSKLF
ncbi:MAG: hypothetical protein ACLUV3_11940 [Oscillospiraceae bacterium]|uniref:hypothetical protein n=2 Tax=Oscillospiraceae TaxID=216572 RepID=UPI003077BDB7